MHITKHFQSAVQLSDRTKICLLRAAAGPRSCKTIRGNVGFVKYVWTDRGKANS